VSKEEQVCYYSLFHVDVNSFFFILGPPGPAGNDGLPGGKFIIERINIVKLSCYFFMLQNLAEMDILVQKVNVVKMVYMVQM